MERLSSIKDSKRSVGQPEPKEKLKVLASERSKRKTHVGVLDTKKLNESVQTVQDMLESIQVQSKDDKENKSVNLDSRYLDEKESKASKKVSFGGGVEKYHMPQQTSFEVKDEKDLIAEEVVEESGRIALSPIENH